MQSVSSPDPSPIYPQQEQMQTDSVAEISPEHSEQPQIQISSPQPDAIQTSHEVTHDEPAQDPIICRWNHCNALFHTHSELANHLSEAHIGWKRPDYFCEWEGCVRRNIKSHSRFALMMHLRTHTGEKPYECLHPGCPQTFSRMDAMLKHKKAEHDDVKPEPLMRFASSRLMAKGTRKPVASPTKHQRTEENHETKSKRKKTQDDRTPSTGSQRPATAQRGYSDEDADTALSFQDKYRLAKAKLSYITQENEMLTDECNEIEKKLRRLRTERRILLDVLYRTEMGHEDDEVDKQNIVIDDDDDDVDDDIDDEDDL